MSALTSLTDEHQMIIELLGALQTYATRLRSGATVDPADLARFSEVFRELVDYRHHEKEEGVLFPFLARNGFEWSSGPLAELHGEHGHLRYLIDVLCQAAARDLAARDLPASREQRRQIAEAAAAFVEFKRRHIQREEAVLIPMIAQRLSPSVLEQLGAELRQFDVAAGRNLSAQHGQKGSSSLIYQQAAELVQRYTVDSGTVDLTAVQWTALSPPVVSPPVVSRDEAAVGLTSFGRSR
jgi:hemerythrin-like domain-containing protein